ncbi:MAG TPA: hypothetical protein VEJ37_09900 [Xanthobacteraceae bacterium]|nr:hypothetical protein [Xanthobacteraceae bacterium]
MSKHHLGLIPPRGAEDYGAVQEKDRTLDAGQDVTQTVVNGAGLADADRAQLERDIAAIERASAALRRAEPALESWTTPPKATLNKPRPVWLLIGVLWISAAMVTLGAVFAISALVD